MDLKTRKLNFIQEFLNVQNEEVILRLEKMLKKEKRITEAQASEPMTKEKLNKRIDQSESDFRNNRFKNSSELLTKYQ